MIHVLHHPHCQVLVFAWDLTQSVTLLFTAGRADYTSTSEGFVMRTHALWWHANDHATAGFVNF